MTTRITRVLACLAFLTLISSPGLTQDDLRYKELPNFHWVSGEVYRGAQPKPGGLPQLVQLGIKTIINLRDDDQRAQGEEAEARMAGLRYFNIPVARLGRPHDAEIEKVMTVLNDPESQPVFVHCKHGADRTGVVIAVYRIAHDGWTSEQAKVEAKQYGMKFWQLGMKDYIHDFYVRRLKQRDLLTQPGFPVRL